MASIETRGTKHRVVWRFDGVKQFLTCDSEDIAEQAKELVEGYRGRVSRDKIEAILFGDSEESDDVPTLAAWAPVWLASKTRIGPRGRRDYGRQLKNEILPVLGEKRLDEIRATDIGLFLNGLRRRPGKKPLAPATVTRFYSLIHGILAAAVREGHIPENPAELTDFVRDQIADDDTGEEDRVYLTPEDFEVLLGAFKPDDRPFVEVAAGTGARWGEITALMVKHLAARPRDGARKLRVWQAWKLAEDGSWYLGTTKGRQRRAIGIDDDLDRLLCLQAVVFDGRMWHLRGDDELLFTAPEGGRLVHSNYLHRVWEPAVIRASRCEKHPPAPQASRILDATGRCGEHGGRLTRADKPCLGKLVPGWDRCRDHMGPLPDTVSQCDCRGIIHARPTPHDLRHTHAAWLFADSKVSPLAISRRLGHANLSTTSEIYGGLAPSAEEAAVDAVAEAMGRLPRPTASTD